jgi:dTDP-glucose pyrophosphorylase/predicted transcriptional regulator
MNSGMKFKIDQLQVTPESTFLQALKKMDKVGHKLLLVMKDGKFTGLLSIGDIQRAIINNYDLDNHVQSIMRKDYIVARPGQSIAEIKALMIKIRAEFMPVVDDDNNLLDVHFWEDLFGEEIKAPLFRFNLPVVIMAGGTGTRLRPLTYVIPKPMIPFGNKTFIEAIFEKFHFHGCDTFYISVNYKADLIEYYLNMQQLSYNLSFFKEEQPMGTAGSLSLLKGKINETFFVSNCDILIDQDLSEVLSYHRESHNEITVVAAMKHFPIAYGTLESGDNGRLLQLIEKPELTFKINSGMYIIEPHLLDEIPDNQFFHITQLIENVNARDGRVGVFPVSEKSWKDIGNWSLFLKENEINY